MSTITKYQDAKFLLQRFSGWAGKIGRKYHGGGGGVGKVTNALFKATIYHQPSDGDTNYHESETAFADALNEAAKELAPQIIARAMALLENKVRDAAMAAEKEAKEVLAEIRTEGTPQL